jgi:enamine deaminase RidA (YjgF/YER057c/UK114 family)
MTDEPRTFFEVYSSDPRVTAPLGVCVDGVVYGSGLNGIDPLTGEAPVDDSDQLIRTAAKLRELIEGAGGSIADLKGATVFVPHDWNPAKIDLQAFFGSLPGLPVRMVRIVPTRLPSGQFVSLDAFAFAGKGAERPEELSVWPRPGAPPPSYPVRSVRLWQSPAPPLRQG